MRLIDADGVRRKAVPHTRGERAYCADIRKWAVLVADIDDAPTIEAKPVVHGEWIVLGQRTYGSGGGRNYTHYCSECGQHGFEDYKLCPNCGADMRERNTLHEKLE